MAPAAENVTAVPQNSAGAAPAIARISRAPSSRRRTRRPVRHRSRLSPSAAAFRPYRDVVYQTGSASPGEAGGDPFEDPGWAAAKPETSENAPPSSRRGSHDAGPAASQARCRADSVGADPAGLRRRNCSGEKNRTIAPNPFIRGPLASGCGRWVGRAGTDRQQIVVALRAPPRASKANSRLATEEGSCPRADRPHPAPRFGCPAAMVARGPGRSASRRSESCKEGSRGPAPAIRSPRFRNWLCPAGTGTGSPPAQPHRSSQAR